MRALAILLSAVFGLGFGSAFAQEPPGEEAPPAEAAAADAAALNPLATLDKGALTGFRDMPLFTPSRRRPAPPAAAPQPEPQPEPEPVAAAAPPPPPEPELKLTGVIEGPEGAVAVVQKNGEAERLRLGDQVDDWLVTGIEGYALKLTLNEREAEYRLFERSESEDGSSAAEPSDEDDDLDDPSDRGRTGARPPLANRPQPPRAIGRP